MGVNSKYSPDLLRNIMSLVKYWSVRDTGYWIGYGDPGRSSGRRTEVLVGGYILP